MSAADPTKRALMTIGDSSEVLKKPVKGAGTESSKSKSLRFDLDLFEPDEYRFPEFNYKKLVHIEKKKQKKLAKLPNGNHSDPFAGDENDDVERITRELEAKYGSGTAYGASSRLPLVDRGAGYDATDSFIDDTEAYDELIPEELEADRGGFYINSGSLEFKKMSNFERPGDEIRMPKAKKRALSTSSESSAAEDAVGKERSLENQKKKAHVEKKTKTAATSSSDEQGKAKKQKKEKLDKQEKLDKPKEVAKDVTIAVKEPEKKKEIEKDAEKMHKTTTVKDMLRAKRDHQRKIELGKSSGTTTATDEDEEGEVESVSSIANTDSSCDSHHDQPPTNGLKEIHLPENLPADVVTAIASLKQRAEAIASSKLTAEPSAAAKINFFVVDVLDQLVKLDNTVKDISSNTRVQVFNYLEQFVPCTKKVLFAKVRKHRVHQFETKVKSEINKLRKVISESMTAQIARHENELMKYEEMKTVQNVIGPIQPDQVAPRKKFHWNEISRAALHEIIRHLKDLFKCPKKSKESELDFLSRRLRSDVIPLWPEGWMRIEDINREVERKKKKEVRAAAIAAQESPPVQIKPKNPNNSTEVTNGKSQAHKTEPNTKLSVEAEASKVSTATSLKTPTPSASPSSVIKRSSDHSINSIISASPSPPNTIQSIKAQELKPHLIDLEKLASPSELLKAMQQKPPLPRYNISPIESDKMSSDKVRRSDSSDSDCVEIVGEFNPIKPAKPLYHNNSSSKVNQTYGEPFAKKSKKHGSDEGEHETDYSKIIMGLQSLTDPKKSNQYFAQSPSIASPIAQQQQRKTEASHAIFDNTS